MKYTNMQLNNGIEDNHDWPCRVTGHLMMIDLIWVDKQRDFRKLNSCPRFRKKRNCVGKPLKKIKILREGERENVNKFCFGIKIGAIYILRCYMLLYFFLNFVGRYAPVLRMHQRSVYASMD